MPAQQPYRFGFVMEQTLGHVTHYHNLRAAIDCDPTVEATWLPLGFAPRGALETLPLLRDNWSARASVRAWRLLRHTAAPRTLDALLFHTQVPTLLCAGLMRQIPTVISLDATPRNYDSVGSAYGHHVASPPIERLKQVVHRRTLHAARALITWCAWAKHSLIADYGIEPSLISVIPPGVPLDRWPAPAPRHSGGPVRILFVGADFPRKGGEQLLQAFAALQIPAELHLVTKAAIEPAPQIRTYRDLTPNSEVLKQLYATADIFVLPTLADCFPLVIQEALAAGLPVVASDVGAIGEAVRHGSTGLLVPPGDVRALTTALGTLINDPQRRRMLGRQGRVLAEQHFDSTANARRILALMTTLVSTAPAPAAAPLDNAVRSRILLDVLQTLGTTHRS